MKLTKAIEELRDLCKVGLNRLTPDEKDAIQLGIENMEQTLERRNRFPHLPHLKLPSED